MIRGTTPTFRLTINDDSVDLTQAEHVYVTFKQGCGISLSNTGSDVEVQAKQVDVYLAQKETLLFRTGQLDIQLNWTYDQGQQRACSRVVTIEVEDNLIGRVIK